MTLLLLHSVVNWQVFTVNPLYDHDLQTKLMRIKINHRATYLRWRSFCSKIL